MFDDLTINLYAYKVFKNNKTDIISLIKWTKSLTNKDIDIQFVMEATGVYHQKFAYYLDEKGFTLSVILPNKISNYMRTLDTKTINRSKISKNVGSSIRCIKIK